MERKIALVTGCSKGIGLELCKVLAAKGYDVLGAARSAPPEGFPGTWIASDITLAADREQLAAALRARGGRLDLLANNAGVGMYATWAEADEQEMRALFELNFFAMVALTKLLLPELKSVRGTVLNISSVAERLSVPCMGAYCASKHAVGAFSATLRMELAPMGVRVVNAVLGRIATGFSNQAYGGRRVPDSPAPANATRTAQRVFAACERGKSEIVYPRWYRAIVLIARWFPGLYARRNAELWGLKNPSRN